jgi:HPt (histidine-containing phosphotransfer) domain-containing protein
MQDSSSPKTTTVVRVETNTVKIVQKYIQNCRLRFPDLMHAADQKDFPMLIQEAHKIKGTAGLMSVIDLSTLGARLEIAARANDLSEVQRQLEALSQYLSTLTIAAMP